MTDRTFSEKIEQFKKEVILCTKIFHGKERMDEGMYIDEMSDLMEETHVILNTTPCNSHCLTSCSKEI